jgi:hypothetical protein
MSNSTYSAYIGVLFLLCQLIVLKDSRSYYFVDFVDDRLQLLCVLRFALGLWLGPWLALAPVRIGLAPPLPPLGSQLLELRSFFLYLIHINHISLFCVCK